MRVSEWGARGEQILSALREPTIVTDEMLIAEVERRDLYLDERDFVRLARLAAKNPHRHAAFLEFAAPEIAILEAENELARGKR